MAYYESDRVDVTTTREPQPYENHQLTINKGVSQETSDWEIGEILVFNKKLNADEEQSVVSYLERTFYGPDGYDPVGNNREMHYPYYAFDGDASNTSYIAPTGTFANNNLDETAIDNSLQILASDISTLDYFGNSVAIDGNYVLVGAYRKDSYQGSAYLYKFSESGNTTFTIDNSYQIFASDAAGADYFGWSVAINGNYALVGAFKNDICIGSRQWDISQCNGNVCDIPPNLQILYQCHQ